MAEPTSQASAGIMIFYGTVGEEPATQLTELKKMNSIPAPEAVEYQTTRMDAMDGDDVDWWKYFELGKVDPGTLEWSVGMKEADVVTLYSLLRQKKSWKFQFASGAKLTFNGSIKKIAPEAPEDDEIIFNLTVRVSGAIVFTAAA